MGYFNYFIKCIIRNITYKLCKPKVLIIFLLFVSTLFLFQTKGFCAWDDSDIQALTYQVNSLIEQNNNQLEWLVTINTNLAQINSTKLEEIKSKLDSGNADLTEIKQELIELNENVNNILKQLTGDSSSFSYRYSGLSYAEIIPPFDNLEQSGNFYISDSGSINVGYKKIDYLFKSGITYTFTFDKTGSNEVSTYIYYTTDDVVAGQTFYANYLGRFTGSNVNFSITPEKDIYITLLTDEAGAVSGSNGTWTITGVSKGLINELQGTMNQNNQLQQEQNQLQQEQNDFLKQETSDDDVSIDSFNSVDSNDITSSGLTGIFNSIYNSISSWSSKDIVLPVPFTNKSITIQANYTNNMLNSVGGQTLINIVSTIYYFLVARFIIYSITGIINSIKSGSILETDTKNNITTEML